MSEELRPCPFCKVNDWQYHAHFSGTTIRQCGVCGTIVDESVINTRPIEDAMQKRIAELEEKQRWRVVANGELPEDGEVVWLWDGKYIGMGYYLVFAGQFMDRYTPLRPIRPSHWMRFPESPEVQE